MLKEHSPTRNQLPALKTHEENSKKIKNSKPPHILGVSMKGALSGKKEKKNLRIRAARIPAETASRSFRKLEDSFKIFDSMRRAVTFSKVARRL